MIKIRRNKYDVGDIVFVNKYNYKNNNVGNNHLFVIIDDDDRMFPLEYFGLIVSSHREKSKNNSGFKFNEPLNSSFNNKLKYDSIVKCDQLYKFPKRSILFKIGSVDVEDFIRFIKAYELYLRNVKDLIRM